MDGLRCYKLLFKPTPPFPQIDQTKIGRDLNFSMDSDSGDTFWVIIVAVIVLLLFMFVFFRLKLAHPFKNLTSNICVKSLSKVG